MRLRSPSTRWVARAAILIALAPLAVGFIRYLGVAYDAIVFPYGLDYGEGVVWVQMREMAAGRGYGPIDGFPSFVFHYPPLYHLLTQQMASGLGLDELLTGRLLSVLATIATCVVIGMTAAHMAKLDGAGRRSWICGLIAALIVISTMPVLHWSRLMRVDMLALLFSFAGLYCGLRSVSRPGFIHLAACFFTAAVFTKQISVAAPIAVFATMLLIHPRTALAGIGSGLLFALSGLALVLARFGAGFIEHIVVYNMNTVEWGRLAWIGPMLAEHAIFIAVGLFALASRISRLLDAHDRSAGLRGLTNALARSPRDSQTAILLVYLLVATIMLATIVKSGSSYNYFIEWLCIIAILAGLGMRDVVLLATGGLAGRRPTVAVLAPLALAGQSLVLPDLPQDSWHLASARRLELDKLTRLIAAARRPVISDDLVLLIKAGRTPMWEPFTFPELAAKGLWDERPMIERIRRKDFAFFIADDVGPDALAAAYGPTIGAAIASAYPIQRSTGGMIIRLPSKSERSLARP